jgi:hypothetical protein
VFLSDGAGFFLPFSPSFADMYQSGKNAKVKVLTKKECILVFSYEA